MVASAAGDYETAVKEVTVNGRSTTEQIVLRQRAGSETTRPENAAQQFVLQVTDSRTRRALSADVRVVLGPR